MYVTSATAVLQGTIAEWLFWNTSPFCLPVQILWQHVLYQTNTSTPILLNLDWKLIKLFTTRWLLWWLFSLTWTYQCLLLRVPNPLYFWSSLQGNTFINFIIFLAFRSESECRHYIPEPSYFMNVEHDTEAGLLEIVSGDPSGYRGLVWRQPDHTGLLATWPGPTGIVWERGSFQGS